MAPCGIYMDGCIEKSLFNLHGCPSGPSYFQMALYLFIVIIFLNFINVGLILAHYFSK